MPSPSLTRWTKTHTKIRHLLCSCWETTSRYGHQTHKVMEMNHQSATRTNQPKFRKCQKIMGELEMKKKQQNILLKTNKIKTWARKKLNAVVRNENEREWENFDLKHLSFFSLFQWLAQITKSCFYFSSI